MYGCAIFSNNIKRTNTLFHIRVFRPEEHVFIIILFYRSVVDRRRRMENTKYDDEFMAVSKHLN